MSLLTTKFNFTDQLQAVTEIDDAVTVTINLGSEIKNNTMRINLKNAPVDFFSDGTTIRHRWVNADGTSVFKAVKVQRGEVIDDEIIDIYAKYEENDATINVESEDYLIFSGVITKGTLKSKVNTQEIELSCKDRNVIALDKLTIPQSFKPTDSNNTTPLIIKQLIRNASENSNSNSAGFDTQGTKFRGGSFLIDARLFSESILTSGATTSTSTRQLVDSGANFVNDEVEKGDWVRNSTDDTYATVTSVATTTLDLSKDIFVSGEDYEVSDGFIQDTRPDGTAFPAISFSQRNKPVTESVSDLSQTNKTNTVSEASNSLVIKRGMRWFIDNKSRFHLYVPTDTPEYVMQVGTSTAISPDTVGHIIQDVELNNEVDTKINFIIFKAGEDMDGDMISSYSRAQFSGIPNTKDSFRSWLEIARGMKEQDAEAGNITKNQFDDYNYPDGGDYPLTPAWDRQERSVSNDTEYNDNFKEEAIIRGEEKSQSIFQKQANPRWAGKLQLRGEDFVVGDLIDFTDKSKGLNNILLRINAVSHIISNQQGWVTTLTVEEDEEEIEIIA